MSSFKSTYSARFKHQSNGQTGKNNRQKLRIFFTNSCVRRLLRFGFNAVEIAAMAKPYCCKEAQAAPLHE
jgi:hypothetical protein